FAEDQTDNVSLTGTSLGFRPALTLNLNKPLRVQNISEGPYPTCPSGTGQPFDVSGIELPSGAIFSLPAGPIGELKLTKTFKARSIQTVPPGGLFAEVTWTLDLDLQPVLWCEPGKTIPYQKPGGLGPSPLPNSSGKPWSITYGDLFLSFVNSKPSSQNQICASL